METLTGRPTEAQRATAEAYYSKLYSLRLRVIEAHQEGWDALAEQLTGEIHQAAPWLYLVDWTAWGGIIATHHFRAHVSFDKADKSAAWRADLLARMARKSRGE